MSWKNNSSEERGPLLTRATEVVRDVVAAYRRRGSKVQHAFTDAALDLDTTPRRVRSLYYLDGVWAVTRAEHDRLLRRWGRHLDRRMAENRREAEALRVSRAQLQLDLDDNNKQSGASEWAGGGTPLRRWPNGAGDAP